MKCDVCRDRPAVIFVQQVSRGSSIELHLCESCARERGFSTAENKIDISLGGLFSGILDGSIDGETREATDLTAKKNTCPVCGLKLSEIKKLHKTGCAGCYTHFKGEIVALLRTEGIEISYTGILPLKTDTFTAINSDPENLKKELQRALDQEDYEMAAYYRDRLRAIGEGSK